MSTNPELNTLQKELTRTKILEAGFRIFAEKTIEKVTMTDVAEAAGVGVATVYRYYKTKPELMGGATLFIKCLYSFFMPLMFLNAGIIIHRNVVSGSDSRREFIRGLFRTFIITYFLWALIYSIFSYKNLLWIIYGSKEALIHAGTLEILWFLPCMFIARLLNEIVFHIVDALPLGNKKIGCGVFIIIFFAIGVPIITPYL